jgi:hypothetical protein
MLNTKQVEATLAVEELDNEVAAAIQGGRQYALEVYRHANGNDNDRLGRFDTKLSALSSNANDQISSIRVNAGRWMFYEDANYQGRSFELKTPGLYNLPSGFNDTISSWERLYS